MLPSGLSLPEFPPMLLALGAEGRGLLDLAPTDMADLIATHVIGTVPPWNRRRAIEIGQLEERPGSALDWGELWLESIADHPWMQPFDAGQQGWVSQSEPRTPDSGLFTPPGVQTPLWFNCDLMPENGSLGTTTTLVGDDLWLLPDAVRAPEGAPIWRLSMAGSACVRDIRTCDDWSALVAAYPRLISDADIPIDPSDVRIPGPVYGVDWAAASADLDGVRLTLEGLVRIAYCEIPVLEGTTTFVLNDVTWEHTLWLRWVVLETARLGEWARPS